MEDEKEQQADLGAKELYELVSAAESLGFCVAASGDSISVSRGGVVECECHDVGAAQEFIEADACGRGIDTSCLKVDASAQPR